MPTKLHLLLIVSVFFVRNAPAQNINSPLGAAFAGMGNATVMMQGPWAIHHNQAGLGYIDKTTVGFHFHNEFLLKELGLKALSVAIPAHNNGVIGAVISHFGYAAYNQSKIGIAYGKSFNDIISIGIMLDYFNIHQVEEYISNTGAATFEIGIMSKPLKNLYVGAHVFNPTGEDISGMEDEKLPVIMRLGAGYNFSDIVLAGIETEKSTDSDKAIVKTGIEIKFRDNLLLRAGISSEPVKVSFGIGYVFKKLTADIAFSTHPVLGTTPYFSMQYEIGKEKEKIEGNKE